MAMEPHIVPFFVLPDLGYYFKACCSGATMANRVVYCPFFILRLCTSRNRIWTESREMSEERKNKGKSNINLLISLHNNDVLAAP